MDQKLGSKQLKAWEIFITRQASVLRKIEQDLENREGVLPLHWYDVLLVLSHAENGKLRFNEIADQIVTSRSALSRSIEKLELQGYVKREKAPEDARGQYAMITEKGRSAQKASWVHYRASIQKHFGRFLTTEDAINLELILDKISI